MAAIAPCPSSRALESDFLLPTTGKHEANRRGSRGPLYGSGMPETTLADFVKKLQSIVENAKTTREVNMRGNINKRGQVIDHVEDQADADNGDERLSQSAPPPACIVTADNPLPDPEQAELLEESRVDEHPKESKSAPLIAYLILASAVMGMASIGPLLDLQRGCTPTMKIYWRMSGTGMLLFPFAVVSVRSEGLAQLSGRQLITLVATAASYATMCVGFALSLQYTSIGNATVLANTQAIMLLIAKSYLGEPVSMIERSGAVTAFVGAVLLTEDSSEHKNSDGKDNAFLGDASALISGLGGALYLTFAKRIRGSLALYPFMFLVMMIGSTFTLLFQIFVLREHVSFSRHVTFGTWGWMNWQADRFPLELIMILVCNVIGVLGNIRAMRYFDNLVISVAGLTVPVLTELMALGLGVGVLPGIKGWIGNFLVAVGMAAVIAPTRIAATSEGASM